MESTAAHRAHLVREQLPADGLLAGQRWRVALEPFPLGPALARTLTSLGRVLLQFYRAVNLLYRQSAAGEQPAWIADCLDRGKPSRLIALQRHHSLRHEIPRIIRPDLLLTDQGLSITELDSVPGGIGLTAWLNQTYARLPGVNPSQPSAPSALPPAPLPALPRHRQPLPSMPVLGGADGMLVGFAGIFGSARQIHIVVSEEAATYRPEMIWLAKECNRGSAAQPGRSFQVRPADFHPFARGDAVYRFFELFDLANVPCAETIFDLAVQQTIRLTPPPKPVFEEKMLFALLWNRNLRGYWRQHLGEAFFKQMLQCVPYTWIVDPSPLPPQAAFPELDLTGWHQLKTLSQRERNLILKISGYSDRAWGARGVYLGSDLPLAEWSEAVDKAIDGFERSPYVLQRYHKPKTLPATYFDFDKNQPVQMPGRVRLCPYYFVHGDGDSARAHLGGVLATICPADKKIIHGMKDAILAPCSV